MEGEPAQAGSPSSGVPCALRWTDGLVASPTGLEVELWDTVTGVRVAVDAALLDAVPRPGESDGVERLPPATRAALARRGFLVPPDPPPPTGPPGLLGVPSVPYAEVVSGRVVPDVAILGVPFDGGVASMPGARHGPEIARRFTIDAFSYGPDLAIRDTYDPVARTPVLPGRVVVDVGDACPLPADPRAPREATYESVENTVRRLRHAGAIPVVIGGDHSITAAVVRGLAGGAPFRVVVLDAHCDFQHVDSPGYASVHHANFLAHVLAVPDVVGVDVAGVREYVGPEAWPLPDRLRCTGTSLDLDLDGTPVYLSIDLDVIDPTHTDATGHPSAGGVGVDDVLAAIRRIVAGRTLVGIDVVEPLPDERQNARTGTLVSRLVLDAIRANLDGGR